MFEFACCMYLPLFYKIFFPSEKGSWHLLTSFVCSFLLFVYASSLCVYPYSFIQTQVEERANFNSYENVWICMFCTPFFLEVLFIQEPLVNMRCSVTILGTYQDSPGQSNCTNCPAGHSCADRSATPVQCLAGTYSLLKDASCTICPAGSYQNVAGQSSCSQCPAGSSCVDRSASPVACNPGTYSLLGDGFCTNCGNRTYQKDSGQSSCLTCPSGYTCPDTSSTPSICLEGTYSPQGDTLCHACHPGYYQDTQGQAACTLCPAGHNCSDPALTATPCAAGSYSGAGESVCTTCPSGMYQNQTGQLSCLDCPGGYACPLKSSTPSECPAGSYSKDKDTLCANCPDGQYQNQSGQTVDITYFLCFSDPSSYLLILLLCVLILTVSFIYTQVEEKARFNSYENVWICILYAPPLFYKSFSFRKRQLTSTYFFCFAEPSSYFLILLLCAFILTVSFIQSQVEVWKDKL